MAGIDYFNKVKPQLNKLNKLNIYDSLFVIRQYVEHSFNGYKLNKPNFQGIELPFRRKIPVYLADFLIANIIKRGSLVRANDSLRNYKTRTEIINYWHDIYDECNKIAIGPEPFVWLKSYVFTQYKMQHFDHIYYRLYKYYFLYKSENVSLYTASNIGIDIHKYFTAIMFLYYIFAKSFRVDRQTIYGTMTKQVDCLTEQDIDNILTLFTIDIKDLKRGIKLHYKHNNMFNYYNDSLHVNKPLIVDGMNLYCTIPNYILNTTIEGLSYEIDLRSNNEIYNEFATNFEDYIGEQLKYYEEPAHSYNFRRELKYDNGLKTSDWIIWDQRCMIFLDCKLKKLSIEGVQETNIDDSEIDRIIELGYFTSRNIRENIKREMAKGLVKDILDLGVDLGKIYKCYLDYKNEKVNTFPFIPNLKFRAIILTLEECYCNTPKIKANISKVANAYVSNKFRDCPIFEESNFMLLSSAEFDKYIPCLGTNGIDYFWSKLTDGSSSKEENLIVNTFLAEKFETELLSQLKQIEE